MSDTLSYTYLARPVPRTEPTEEELFGDFIKRTTQLVGTEHLPSSDGSSEAMRATRGPKA